MVLIIIAINLIVGYSNSQALEIGHRTLTLRDEKRSDVFNKKFMPLTDMIKTHVVKAGENLWKIASLHNINIDTLIGANDINDINKIKPGDRINILPVKGILYQVNPGENLSSITKKYNVNMNIVSKLNGIENPDKILPGKKIILPGARPEFGYQDRVTKRFSKPVLAKISSPFGRRWGRMHEGIDFAVPIGTKVKSAAAGMIIYSGWARGYGKTVIIAHQKGFKTLYAHNSKLMVKNGQRVIRGQTIAASGNTGTTTGPNIHFEVQVNSRPVDPLAYLR